MYEIQKAINLIKSFEGFRGEPYYCPAGVLTIGYGHAIQPGEHIQSLTPMKAELLLRSDLVPVVRGLRRLVKIPVSDNQFCALLSFTYNVGLGAIGRSTLLHKLNHGDLQGAADQFPKWVYGSGKVLPGLVRRRQEERELFLTNTPDE